MIIYFVMCTSRYSDSVFLYSTEICMELRWTIWSQNSFERCRCSCRDETFAELSSCFFDRTRLKCFERIHAVNLCEITDRLLHILPRAHDGKIFSSSSHTLPICSLKQSRNQNFRKRCQLSPEELTCINGIQLITNTYQFSTFYTFLQTISMSFQDRNVPINTCMDSSQTHWNLDFGKVRQAQKCRANNSCLNNICNRILPAKVTSRWRAYDWIAKIEY